MRRIFLLTAVFAVLVVPGTASAGSDTTDCRKALIDTYLASQNAVSGESTRGDAISDGFYGNEPNVIGGTGGPSEQEPGRKGGRVVPSQSPGPFVTNPDGTVRVGASWGDVQQLVKAYCESR